jgi:transposase
MNNILGWNHWHVLAVETNAHDYLITAERDAGVVVCPHCSNSFVHKHDTRPHVFMDTPLHGRRVGIRVLKKRFQCQVCHHSFYEALPEMHPAHFMTRRLVEYIERESLRRTFTSLAEEIGIDEKSIRLIFADSVRANEQKATLVTPRYLGIDEVKIDGAMRGVFTNIEKHTVLDLIPDRKKRNILAFLLQLPKRETVEWSTIDMYRPYKSAVTSALPQARICVDKFHVVRMATDAVDVVRKQLRTSLSSSERGALKDDRKILLMRQHDLDERNLLLLEMWTANYPVLAHAHALKEQFFAIYDQSSRAAAQDAYNTWLCSITDDVREAFQSLVTACTNWHEEIFNYFDCGLTNSYTETLNGRIKAIVHQTRGASFEVVRAKIRMYGGLHQPGRPRYSLKRRQQAQGRASPDNETQVPPHLFPSVV